jgi:hypothetical protein
VPSSWFATAPSKTDRTRITLNFGLGRADRQLNELVVPQLGRIWFVRQLSWPVAALSLGERLRGIKNIKPSAISHALEALGCKLEWYENPDSERLLGKRAFGRDDADGVWAFEQLRSRRHYVQNTYRQAAVRPIREGVGFGFVTGSRFNTFSLTDIGKQLANAFLDQVAGGKNGRVSPKLEDWIRGGDLPFTPALHKALMPSSPCEAERALVDKRVFGVADDACKRRCDAAKALGTSTKLRDTLEIAALLRDAGHVAHADDVVAARSFGFMLDRARDVAALISERVHESKQGWPVAETAGDQDIKAAVGHLKESGKDFLRDADAAKFAEPKSRAFAQALAGNIVPVVTHVARATKEVFSVAEQRVMQGPLFRVVETTDAMRAALESEDGADALEPDSTGRTFRLANLHSLARDMEGKL